ncbi:MAG: GIY-YIG nuclease family protein [Promethearchaeota archaeon]
MKGTYILIIHLFKDINIKIGALGNIFFKKGYYSYVGSAMGNIGSSTLENRIKRHLLPSSKKKIHWHIDYLLENEETRVIKLYLIPCHQTLECIIAGELSIVADDIVKNFGCSDCKCDSHLFYFNKFNNYPLIQLLTSKKSI